MSLSLLVLSYGFKSIKLQACIQFYQISATKPSQKVVPVQKNTQAEKNIQRAKFIRLLRKIHGWLGLWGALLGLLFGVTGVLLDHRNVMKIPAVKVEEKEIQLPIHAPYPDSREAFITLLQNEFSITHAPFAKKPKKEFSADKTVRFMGKSIPQPGRWEVEFRMPQLKLYAEYVQGNAFALVRKEEVNLWGFLVNLHKGTGASVGWVLMADTMAGGLFVLSITGVLLWTKMRGSRIVLVSLVGGSLVTMLCLIFDML